MPISSSNIDSLINAQYSSITKFGELIQLSKLFDNTFLQSLVKLLSRELSNVQNGFPNKEIEIALCWIDKAPLADYTTKNIVDHNGHSVTQKVELADLAIFYLDEHGHYERGVFYRSKIDNYSVLIQAKKANGGNLPKVPIGTGSAKNNSTAKELALLSGWPVFDMYKTSRNMQPLLPSLQLGGMSTSIYPYGWFMACPPDNTSSWRSRWMCGPSKKGSTCNTTLGELLAALIERSSIAIGSTASKVGESFTFPVISDWDKVCDQIIELCNCSKLPQSIFSSINTSTNYRRVATRGKVSFLMCSSLCGCGKITCNQCFTPVDRLRYVGVANTSTSQIGQASFPVLIISSRPYEGEEQRECR